MLISVILKVLLIFVTFFSQLSASKIDEEFIVEKTADIEFDDQELIWDPSQFPVWDHHSRVSTLEYDFTDLEVDLGILTIEAQMLKLKSKLQKKQKTNFIKFGHTTSPSPILEIGFFGKYLSNSAYIISFKHSSNDDTYIWRYFNDYHNTFKIKNYSLFDNLLLKNYFDISFDKNLIHQNNHSIENINTRYPLITNIICGIKNFETKKLFYDSDFHYSFISITDNLKENKISNKTELFYNLSDTIVLHSIAHLAFYNFQNSLHSRNRFNFNNNSSCDIPIFTNFTLSLGYDLYLENKINDQLIADDNSSSQSDLLFNRRIIPENSYLFPILPSIALKYLPSKKHEVALSVMPYSSIENSLQKFYTQYYILADDFSYRIDRYFLIGFTFNGLAYQSLQYNLFFGSQIGEFYQLLLSHKDNQDTVLNLTQKLDSNLFFSASLSYDFENSSTTIKANSKLITEMFNTYLQQHSLIILQQLSDKLLASLAFDCHFLPIFLHNEYSLNQDHSENLNASNQNTAANYTLYTTTFGIDYLFTERWSLFSSMTISLLGANSIIIIPKDIFKISVGAIYTFF